ncbi:MAG: TetR/AcrR family transcriptional regulator [Ruminococcaceae bacterium]|nr:TetR/AcrR family transcriptional regulator [Oscillospiraceae bacterium]
MYKLCKTEQSAQRQREIEQALFFALQKKSYQDVTITELCLNLNMPRKTFYRYFDSKDDALYALIEHTMLEYSGFKQKEKEGERTLQKEIGQFFAFWQSKKDFLDTFNRNCMLEKIIEVSVNFPINDIVSLSKFLPEDNEWAQTKIFRFAVCGLVTSMIDWYREGFKTNISDMVNVSCRIISQPMFPYLNRVGITLN